MFNQMVDNGRDRREAEERFRRLDEVLVRMDEVENRATLGPAYEERGTA